MKDATNGGVVTHQFMTAVFVECANVFIGWVCKKMTQAENHRTQSEYETLLLMKVMLLKFVNSYFVLYYIAFFKHHDYWFGSTLKCLRNDCFLDLQSQLGMFVFFG